MPNLNFIPNNISDEQKTKAKQGELIFIPSNPPYHTPVETNPPNHSNPPPKTTTITKTTLATHQTTESKQQHQQQPAPAPQTCAPTTNIFSNIFKIDTTQDIKVIQEFSKTGYARTASTFTSYFKSRYQKLSAIFKREHVFDKPICSIYNLVQNQPLTIIGIVYDIRKLPNSYRITVEDLTGKISIVVPANNINAFEKSKKIFADMVLAFTGVLGGRNVFFCDDIILPDIPLQNSYKQRTEKPDVSFVFISDLHIGSKNFLKKSFQHFVDWVCGYYGGTLGVDASKITVIFVGGDLVSGINIYKEQQNDLHIQDLKKQYDEVARYFSKIPKTIKIIIIPGNHDAQRLPTPQPAIMKSFATSLYDLKNVIMTSSPCLVSVFGVNVLLDHGVSTSVLAEINSDFKSMLVSEPQKIGKYLLQARHLYPIYGEARGVLSPELEDFLVIDKIPDIFAFGHVHSCGYMNYRGVHIINPGCFEGMTDYEERIGLTPNPGWAYVYDLATDSVKALCFLDDDEKDLANGINLRAAKEKKLIEETTNKGNINNIVADLKIIGGAHTKDLLKIATKCACDEDNEEQNITNNLKHTCDEDNEEQNITNNLKHTCDEDNEEQNITNNLKHTCDEDNEEQNITKSIITTTKKTKNNEEKANGK